MPGYRTSKGDDYSVSGVKIDECPVSYITPESVELVQLFARTHHAHTASGASLYGPILADWPAWAADALIALEIERVQADNAYAERDALNNR